MLGNFQFYALALAAAACLFGVIIGFLAKRKGYSFATWFGSGQIIVISAIVLAFLPLARERDLDSTERSKAQIRGNRIGLGLTFFGLLAMFAFLAFQILRQTLTQEANMGEILRESLEMANVYLNITDLVTTLVLLLFYVMQPNIRKSVLAILSFILLILILFSYLFHSLIISILSPTDFLPLYFFSTSALRYLATLGLCIGLIASALSHPPVSMDPPILNRPK